MARKGIEEMISEIEIFIDNCKFQPLSSSKIIVPREDLMQMVSELKLKIPNEIERCKKIMRNKEAILADARARADSQNLSLRLTDLLIRARSLSRLISAQTRSQILQEARLNRSSLRQTKKLIR